MKIALAALAAPAAAFILSAPLLASEPETKKVEPAEKVEEAEPVEQAKAEKKICKQINAQMGSRRKTKVCKTREGWKAFNATQRTRAN